MFPPGRAKLSTKPVPIGSAAGDITIGISFVAAFAATTEARLETNNDVDLERDEFACV
jgi:hypothetical protein